MSDKHFWVVVRDPDNVVSAEDVKEAVWIVGENPDDVSVTDADEIRRAVWGWINEHPGVTGCLALARKLNHLGFPCPDDMGGEG